MNISKLRTFSTRHMWNGLSRQPSPHRYVSHCFLCFAWLALGPSLAEAQSKPLDPTNTIAVPSAPLQVPPQAPAPSPAPLPEPGLPPAPVPLPEPAFPPAPAPSSAPVIPPAPAPGPPPPPAQDLTLDHAIDLAFEHNGSLAITKIDVKNYEALKARARAAYLPTLTNTSEVVYLTALEGVVLPQGSIGVFPGTGPVPSKTLSIDQGANLTYASFTNITQLTTQLFAVHALNHAAKIEVDTARLRVEDQSENIAIQVRQLYYGILEAEAQLRSAETQIATYRETDRETAAEVRQGSALPVQELQARANLLQAISTASQDRISAKEQRVKLNNVMGVPLDARYRLVEANPPGPSGQALPPREEAIRLALAQQPQVLIAERQVEKAKAELRVAQDAFIPAITLNAHESYQVGIALLKRNYGVFQGEFSFDLFDGGARRAQVRSEQSLLAEAQQNLSNVRASTTISVEDAYDNVESAGLDLEAQQQLVLAQAEAGRVADAQYAHGELLASNRDQARAQLVAAQAAERQSALNLALAQGEARRALGEVAR